MKFETKCSQESKNATFLNERQRRFCYGVLMGLPATRAYREAGYSIKNEKSIEASSSLLVRNDKVVAYLVSCRKESETETMLTRQKIHELRAQIVLDPNTPISMKLKAMRDEEKSRGWSSLEVLEVKDSLIDRIRGGH